MRNYNIKFNENNTGNNFRYNANTTGFRDMRRFILSACCGIDQLFEWKLVDKCDDIRDLKVGETLFVITSKRECYTAKTIGEFNRTVAMMDNAARKDLGVEYLCNGNNAFMVKRTPEMWKFATLEYDIN